MASKAPVYTRRTFCSIRLTAELNKLLVGETPNPRYGRSVSAPSVKPPLASAVRHRRRYNHDENVTDY